MKDKYLTVTALTRYIKRKIDLDPHLQNIWLKGEVSNFKHHNRGHMYMTIKDEQTRIQAVMFAGHNRFLKFQPEEGMRVLIKGEISVFETNGQYQLYIQQMEPDGIGALYLAYEQLKDKLMKKGYFAVDRKKPIPSFPHHIGVVTSPSGAAIRDIITTLKRRYPFVTITVIPAMVQGQLAAESIKNAIEIANNKKVFDVLIIGRGGGSIEELWPFNEEIVADAVYNSAIPIISAVGHETDTTICDLVADIRAATPTGAAELAVPSRIELQDKVKTTQRLLQAMMKRMIVHKQKEVERLKHAYAFRYPQQLIQEKEQALDRHMEQLEKSIKNYMANKTQKLEHLQERLLLKHPLKQYNESVKSYKKVIQLLEKAINQSIQRQEIALARNMEKLTILNPLETLKRGFAIAYTSSGQLIKTKDQINKNDQIVVTIPDAKLSCTVNDVEEK
ncbi:exodeoxyribonuclease VII large subunit [Virgibacillus soli]|uniref:Exodeoxyribonuclease 7 large subunit n=1 Tax=Paracerasibacillus soli TaxID=480284 RepID=A0ABU5CSK8_9BACI|nr:exodeoxyribonuclease VII large subunit [Virgibacillus soli]MDY0408398.1 exodeoxyribonuclease VII large subunit [Virgibacillus soli]